MVVAAMLVEYVSVALLLLLLVFVCRHHCCRHHHHHRCWCAVPASLVFVIGVTVRVGAVATAVHVKRASRFTFMEEGVATQPMPTIWQSLSSSLLLLLPLPLLLLLLSAIALAVAVTLLLLLWLFQVGQRL